MNATMPPRKVSLYRVTTSTVPTVPVGQLLVEKSGKRVKHWDLFDFVGDGGWSGFTGQRVTRLCPTCVHGSQRAAVLGHPGDCGPDAPLVDVRACEQAAGQPAPEPPAAVCPRCGDCGQIADTPDGEPWTAWTSLPLASSAMVVMGHIRPLPCPDCQPAAVAR